MASSMNSLISVIIPCHNYARYLPNAVGSVIEQTYANWEIIIVNDGSSDDTMAVAERLIADHSGCRIHIINQENSGHPALSRNRGIIASKGDYLLPLDADDMIEPTMLEKCVDVLDKNNSISFVYTDRLDFDGVDQVVRAGNYNFKKLRFANHISYCAMFRRKLWEDAGGYRAVGYEDWDFWVAAGGLGHYGYRIPKPLFKYRRHDTGRFQNDSSRHEVLTAEIVLRNHRSYGWNDIRRARKVIRKHDAESAGMVTSDEPLEGGGCIRRLVEMITVKRTNK